MSTSPAAARLKLGSSLKPKDEGISDLADFVMGFISESDQHEQQRRRFDRIGGNIYYDRHWNVPMPQGRVALTVNIAKALIDHKVSIMCKQMPIPVVECADIGDPEAARMMRSVMMEWWARDGMQEKIEQAETLANTTRTTCLKAMVDYTLYGGAGDVTVDVIPPWRCLYDRATRDRRRLRYAGDRALMTRTRAMQLYPESAEVINEAATAPSYESGGSAQSPVKDPWSRLVTLYPGVAQIDGLWTITGYSQAQSPSEASKLVEVAELYYKDPTLYTDWVAVKDDKGEIKRQPAKDDEGNLKWHEHGHMAITLEDGSASHVPGFRLEMEDVMEEKEVPKYPWYRRTTILIPDCTVIEDRAWDYPLPYAFVRDGETLEGLDTKGTMLSLEDLQAQLNVSLSLMMDNLRFGSHRVGIAYEGAQLERNQLSVSPGDILNVAGQKGSVEFLQFPQLEASWFEWLKNTISLMEQIVGVTGIMQGQAAGRVDSTSAYDLLSEIAGSRLTKATQRLERAIIELMEVVGALIQDLYDEKRSVRVEDLQGNVTFQRIGPLSLKGSFRYNIVVGSTLAWHESGVRARVIEEYQLGFRDWLSTVQALDIPDWREIFKRMKAEGAPLTPPPPPRTRKSIPAAKPKAKPNAAKPGA